MNRYEPFRTSGNCCMKEDKNGRYLKATEVLSLLKQEKAHISRRRSLHPDLYLLLTDYLDKVITEIEWIESK